MTISRGSWHYRAYAWWYRRKHGYPCEQRVVNLCPYMRAILLWSWLRWLLTDQQLRVVRVRGLRPKPRSSAGTWLAREVWVP